MAGKVLQMMATKCCGDLTYLNKTYRILLVKNVTCAGKMGCKNSEVTCWPIDSGLIKAQLQSRYT